MKKFLSIFTLLAVLIALCACGKTEDKQVADTATLDPSSPEAMYGHIDETQPQDGVYKIWSPMGVKNIASHPDAAFELLCNVDMGGAVLAPIPTFTGTFNGGNFTVSNFTVAGDGESFGFVSVNRGEIHNLYLDKVTFVPGENAKNIGSLVGSNEGSVLRCTVTGTMAVEKAAADAFCGGLVGVNTGSLANITATVDVTYSASGSATVGGLIGKAQDGTVEFADQNGKLVINGSNKVAGLIAGEAKNTTFTSCAFVGPAISKT